MLTDVKKLNVFLFYTCQSEKNVYLCICKQTANKLPLIKFY